MVVYHGKSPRPFKSLTADEWKNWTLIFSLISLFDILPSEHLTCWNYFVSAFKIYSSPVVCLIKIDQAHDLMRRFFIAAEQLYGPKFFTINCHLHLHLSSCYKDYGPCYGFWLFSFERYNGLLGKYHTNQLSVEIQIMRQSVNDMSVRSSSENGLALIEEQVLFGQLLGSNTGGTSTESLKLFTISIVILTQLCWRICLYQKKPLSHHYSIWITYVLSYYPHL